MNERRSMALALGLLLCSGTLFAATLAFVAAVLKREAAARKNNDK